MKNSNYGPLLPFEKTTDEGKSEKGKRTALSLKKTSHHLGRPVGSAVKGQKLMKEPPVRGRRIIFSYQGKPGMAVYVAGTFNDWKVKNKKMVDLHEDGVYTVGVNLKPGRYEYKFIVNDVWSIDPANGATVMNDVGTQNNVLVVQ